MKRILSLVFALIIAFGLLLIDESAKANNLSMIEIRALHQAEAKGDDITLGEVAELDGFDIERIESLAKVKVARSPMPGKTRKITISQLKAQINRHLDMSEYRLIMSDNVVVSREGQNLPAAALTEKVRQEIAQNYANYDEVRIEIKGGVKDLLLPTGEVGLEVERVGQARLIGGPSSWRLKVMVDGIQEASLLVRAEVEVFGEVTVASERIKRGTMIENDDLTTIKKDISNERIGYNPEETLVVGRQAARDIHPNEALKQSLTVEPVILHKGNPVKVIYRTENMVLTNIAIAMKEGRRGDLIPVRTIEGKKTLYAVVKDPKLVEIIL